MKGKLAALGFFILLFGISPAAISGSVITDPSKIQTTGPRFDVVNYQFYSSIDPAISSHKIMGNELSLITSEANTFMLDNQLTVGRTTGFSNVGIMFNDLRTIAGNANFHRAILSLMDYSPSGYLQHTMLSDIEGTVSPATFPCIFYSSACTNFRGGAAERMYGAMNYQNAINYLKLAGLFEGNTTDIACDTSNGGFCRNLTWHTGSASGPIYHPNWLSMRSLHRADILSYLTGQGSKIGFLFNVNCQMCAFQPGLGWTNIDGPSAKAVLKQGVYNLSTGYNSAPQFNDTLVNSPQANACLFPYSPSPVLPELAAPWDCWDLYTFGYLWTSSPVPIEFQEFNSAYLSNGVNPLSYTWNPSDYYNRSMDYFTNKVIYATSVSEAESGIGQASLIQMQNLPWLNVYFENTIWVVLSAGWTGYANIPTIGPNSLQGLHYTLLNLHKTCFPLTCKTGGTVNYGLAANVDFPGGLTPMAYYNSVYDADITNQIYETPLMIGPTQFTQPGALTNWMTSSYSSASYTGTVGPDHKGGWFIMQNITTARIHHGQVITLTFKKNLYFSDHVPVTAYDYNFSLFVSRIISPPWLNSGTLVGPTGLIATRVLNPQTIQIFINSSSIWNLGYVQVPVIPRHIFRYINVGAAWPPNTFDTTYRFGAMGTSNGCVGCKKPGPYPAWLLALPNLEVGTGPFTLRSWAGAPAASQHGQLLRNPTYHRAAWSMNDTNNRVTYGAGKTFVFKARVYEWTYSTTKCASSPDKICKVPITSGVYARLYLVNSAGTILRTFTLTCASNGVCKGTIPVSGTGWTHSLAGKDNELVFKATYTYLGLARTWYQQTGVLVHN